MAHRVRQAPLLDLEQLAPLFDRYRQFYGRASDVTAAREFLLAGFTNKESTLLTRGLLGSHSCIQVFLRSHWLASSSSTISLCPSRPEETEWLLR